MRVKVICDGPLGIELDEKIRQAMKSIGMKWYAEGKATDSYRDICFDYKPTSEEKLAQKNNEDMENEKK